MSKFSWSPEGPSAVIFGDNLPLLREFPSESMNLIYIDPPFNTGRVQKRQSIKTTRSTGGSRVGFKGQFGRLRCRFGR